VQFIYKPESRSGSSNSKLKQIHADPDLKPCISYENTKKCFPEQTRLSPSLKDKTFV